MTIQPASVVRKRGVFRSPFVALAALFLWGALVIPAFSWSPGTAAASDTGRFGVDTANRRDVLSFFHAVYGASEGFEARTGWTGNVAALAPGTTGLELKKDVLRRVNFYRALAGLPADLILNPEKSVKAQEAALLAARNRALSHHPGSELPAWAGLTQLPLGVEASAKSNLSLGAYGPAAVDGQIRDDGDANWYVGHRRWLLSPRQAEIGTGDVPEQAGFPAANAIWVVGDFKDPVPAQYVLWPNKGYIPAPLLPKRWSVSYPGADFSSATVSVSRNGVPVPVQITSTSSGPADGVQGEKTLVWEPSVPLSVASEDVTYSVQVNGIRIGGTPGNLAYTVVVFDPGVLGETLSITGGGDLTPAGGSYVFNGIAQADSYELTVARGSAAAWMEGAEGPVGQVLTNTTPGYAVVQSQVAASGLSAFHLTHPGITSAGFADQTFQLKRRLVPGPDSVLQFTETGRFAETSTTLNAEVSVDDGLNWTSVWSRTGVGLNSALFDKGWNPHAVSLGAYSGKAVLVRFSLKSNGGPVAAGTTKDHGFFIDNILLTNGLELVDAKVTTLAGTATGFVLDRATAGAGLMEGNSYYLSVAPRVGTRLFPSSPLTVASVPVVSALATAAVGLPVIDLQPIEVRAAAGFPAVFSVQAKGGGTLRYQWRKNGVALSGQTAATYRIESAQKSDEGLGGTTGYDVVVTGDAGIVTSTRVALTVVEGGAYILENPAGSSVKLGGSHTMWVTSADTEVTYQWRKNGVAITGATGSSFTFSAFKDTDVGRYDVVLRNAFGEVWSSPAYLGVASKVVPNLQKATYRWTTLAGNGLAGNANGTGLAAQFDNPSSIAMDGLGTLYVSDTGNHVIRKVTQAGVVTTVAGLAGTPGTANGSALSTARLDSPKGIAVDKSGAVYIAEPNSNTVRKLTNPGLATAVVSTVAGVAGQFDVAGSLNGPLKVALDQSGNLYVLDYSSIRRVVNTTQFSLLFGELPEAYSGTQPGPIAMTVDSGGKIFAAAYDAGELKIFSSVAGGTFGATNYGPYPFPITDLAVGAGSTLYAASESSVELLGDISQSTPASGLPVSLTSAINRYAAPCALTVDAGGTVYAVDSFLNTVIKGEPSGLPVFLSHPTGGKGANGVPFTLTAIAVSPGTIAYQWYRDGVAVAGATEASYTMESGGSGGGVYTVEASNAAGTVTSTAATVEGVATTLEILTQPQPATVGLGAPAELKVSWESSALTSVQWYRNGVAVTGATSATFSFPAVKASDAGDYRVELRSGPFVRTSNTVKLTVRIPVSIFSQPEDVSVERGSFVSLKVAATGTPPLTYQWRKNGTPIVGANQPTYEFTADADADAEYDVEVNNVVGTRETSRRATVSILTRPAVPVHPQDRIINRDATATFTVTATGSAPLGYQWRRNGVPIAGGTVASLTVRNVQEGDAGSYDVLVSNALGTVISKTAKLSVNLPATIAVQPPATITASIGTSVLLRVVAGGTGDFSYQWLKDNINIPNANQSTYLAPTSVAGTALYSVKVTSDTYGNTVQSAGTTLTVSAARGIAILRAPAPETRMIKGTAAGLKLSVDQNPSNAVRTTYRLFTIVNNALGSDTGISGIVPAGGDLEVPLRSLTTGGTYAVVLSREYSDAEPVTGVRTAAFTVNLRTLEDAAGTYELLLADSNGLVGDGATYRGVLIATVSKTGAVSGRVLYNEAPPLPGADASERIFTAVTRSFSSSFTPSAANPSRLLCTPKLGVGTQANRQALELELDFSAPMVEMNAEVHDRISVAPEVDAEGSVSRGFGAVRGATNLTKVAVGSELLDFSSLTGRYALGSDFSEVSWSGPGLDNNATILAQVLATGKLLWATRLSGFSGSGSATLSTSERDAATAPFYLGRTLSTTTALSTNSLLGQLCFTRLTQGTLWSAKVANAYGEEKLERQSCHITKTNKLPAYSPERFAPINAGSSSFNWSGVGALNFLSGTSCRWTGSTTAGLLALLNPASAVTPTSIPPLYLTAEDPAGEGSYVWILNVSGAGTVKTANYSATDSQPNLTLRLDRTRGEWTGSYVSPSTRLRRTLSGVLARPPEEDSLRGAGWVELGTIPSTQTSGWRLELTAP